MQDDTNTYLTDFHRALTTWLESYGIELQDEVDFPPYRVDIYLSKYHLALEADGPDHHAKATLERDEELLARYHLPVMHVTEELFKNKRLLTSRLLGFMVECQKTAVERYEKVVEKAPWL